MSKYENYDHISKTYDETRTAVGIGVILGLLHTSGKAMADISLLDAGCGTGNYAKVFHDEVGEVICADFSSGMLGKARGKITAEDGVNGQFVQCDLSELPFANNTFDHIICNQSLHHIDSPGSNFANLRKFLTKAGSVLKNDGSIIINTITHRQMRDGVWWAELIQPAIDKMTPRFCSDQAFIDCLDEAGFYIEHRIVPAGEIIQQHGYFDHNSLRSEVFRNGDSHFTLLTESELQQMLDQLDQLEKDGEITHYIEQRDRLRVQVGQFTVFSIRKKQAADVAV